MIDVNAVNAYSEAPNKEPITDLAGKAFKFELGAEVFVFDGDKKIVPGTVVARFLSEFDPIFKINEQKERVEQYRVASDFISDFYRDWRQVEHVEANAMHLLHCFLATKEIKTPAIDTAIKNE